MATEIGRPKAWTGPQTESMLGVSGVRPPRDPAHLVAEIRRLAEERLAETHMYEKGRGSLAAIPRHGRRGRRRGW